MTYGHETVEEVTVEWMGTTGFTRTVGTLYTHTSLGIILVYELV